MAVSGLTLLGNAKGDYTLSPPAGLTADITPKALTIVGLTANDKVYDGNAQDTLSGEAALRTGEAPGAGTSADGKAYAGDPVGVGGTPAGAFGQSNAGDGLTVTVTGLALINNTAGDYTLPTLPSLMANITPAPLTISAETQTKIYDGTTVSTVAPELTQGALVGDDTLTGLTQAYGSKDVLGTNGSTLSVTGYTLSDPGNYAVTTLTAPGTITPATLTVTANARTKVYGTGDPTLTYAANGFQGSDTASTILTGALTRAQYGTLAGEQVGGYAITQGSLASDTADYTIAYTGAPLSITPAPLAVAANNQTKAYGTNDPTLTYGAASGLVSGVTVDGVTIDDTQSSVSYTGALTRAEYGTLAGEQVGGYAITKGTLATEDGSNYKVGSSVTQRGADDHPGSADGDGERPDESLRDG